MLSVFCCMASEFSFSASICRWMRLSFRANRPLTSPRPAPAAIPHGPRALRDEAPPIMLPSTPLASLMAFAPPSQPILANKSPRRSSPLLNVLRLSTTFPMAFSKSSASFFIPSLICSLSTLEPSLTPSSFDNSALASNGPCFSACL